MILTDEDYKAIENNSGFKRCFNGDAFQKIVEATESAVLEKLRQQEPVGHIVTCIDGRKMLVRSAIDLSGHTCQPLYAAPVPTTTPKE